MVVAIAPLAFRPMFRCSVRTSNSASLSSQNCIRLFPPAGKRFCRSASKKEEVFPNTLLRSSNHIYAVAFLRTDLVDCTAPRVTQIFWCHFHATARSVCRSTQHPGKEVNKRGAAFECAKLMEEGPPVSACSSGYQTTQCGFGQKPRS